jgi:alanine dehydrogenase
MSATMWRTFVAALLLTEHELCPLLAWPTLIEAIAQALSAYSAGHAIQPLRTVLSLPPVGTWFGLMPAFLPSAGLAGVKLVTVSPPGPDNPHTHKAVIVLVEPSSGAIVAIMDGRLITERRTAAVSTLAVRLLTRRPPRTVAILGSGAQAESHLSALADTYPLEDVRVWSPSARCLAFADRARETGRPVRAVETAQHAVRCADVVVLATSSATPVIESEWIDDDAMVVSVGACRPTQRELDPALVERSWLLVDSRTSALAESGDVVQGIAEGRFDAAHIRAELGEIVDRRAALPPASGPIVFKSLGLAVEDIAAAALVYRKALLGGLWARSPL